jgi:hypothetical protein
VQASELNRSIIDGSNALSYEAGTVESNTKMRDTMKVTSSFLSHVILLQKLTAVNPGHA